MIYNTKQYDIFKLKDDNREKIEESHIRKLVRSIQSKNLLELRPILVNKDMEVIDGQHRLKAAKFLGLDIYYEVNDNLENTDIILLNIAKNWAAGDYMNYYCKNGFIEYQKLRDFQKKHNLTLKIAINICMGASRIKFSKFKNGEFVFHQNNLDTELDTCWETIDMIKKMNGFSIYTSSSRFWKALIMLVTNPDFEVSKWRKNLPKMIQRFCPKAKTADYLLLMMEIYNYHNHQKIQLLDGVL